MNISLSTLKNNSLFTLGLRINELVSKRITPEMGIDYYYNLFNKAFQEFKAAMEQAVFSAAELAEKDSFRDQMWVALRLHVKNYLRHPEESAAAQRILTEIDKYGSKIYSLSYESESAIIQNVCATLGNDFSSEMAAINAMVWFDLLVQANNDFEAAQRSVNQDKITANETEAATNVRPELEKAIRNLLAYIPMQAEVSGNAELQQLVKELEVETSRF